MAVLFLESDICLDFIFDLPDPKDIFECVMNYAEKSGKGEWQSFGYVFSQNNITVVFRLKEDGYMVGYMSGEFLPNNDFFVQHGYVRSPIVNCSRLLERVAEKISLQYQMPIGNMIIHSDKPEKLWERWGFEVSNEKIFKRKLGG